jgi:nitrate reductase delta subunit
MTLLESIAGLLTYPDERYHDIATSAATSATVESAAPLVAFANATRDYTVVELQELYIQTFDLNPVCSLEVGWHLFGENYDRGILLVRMRGLLEIHGIPESTELPDHLTHALLLLDRMSDEQSLDFAAACVVPALHKMSAAIDGKENVFEPVLESILRVLYARFPEIPLPDLSLSNAHRCHPERGGGAGVSEGSQDAWMPVTAARTRSFVGLRPPQDDSHSRSSTIDLTDPEAHV